MLFNLSAVFSRQQGAFFSGIACRFQRYFHQLNLTCDLGLIDETKFQEMRIILSAIANKLNALRKSQLKRNQQ
jgi:hypothetical protein